MRILVTGGSGFIGSALCCYLVQDIGASVLNVDKLTYAATAASLRPLEHDPKYRFLQEDIVDRRAMECAFDQYTPDAVIHLAAVIYQISAEREHWITPTIR